MHRLCLLSLPPCCRPFTAFVLLSREVSGRVWPSSPFTGFLGVRSGRSYPMTEPPTPREMPSPAEICKTCFTVPQMVAGSRALEPLTTACRHFYQSSFLPVLPVDCRPPDSPDDLNQPLYPPLHRQSHPPPPLPSPGEALNCGWVPRGLPVSPLRRHACIPRHHEDPAERKRGGRGSVRLAAWHRPAVESAGSGARAHGGAPRCC